VRNTSWRRRGVSNRPVGWDGEHGCVAAAQTPSERAQLRRGGAWRDLSSVGPCSGAARALVLPGLARSSGGDGGKHLQPVISGDF